MKKAFQFVVMLISLTMLGAVASSFALQPLTDYAVRSPNGSNQEIVSKVAIPGGTLYTVATMNNGIVSGSPSTAFVPIGADAVQRYMLLTDVKSASGVPVTATAGAGVPAIMRVAGAMYIEGEAASGVAATDSGLFELNLPDTYVAGSNVPVIVNASISGTGTFTAASTTVTMAAYTEINGVETALTVSAAQQIIAAGSNLAFTITGTGLTPGAHIVLEFTMTVDSVTGPINGRINSISIQG